MGRVVHTILQPPVYLGIWEVGLLGLSAIGLELLLASGLLVIQSLQMRRTGGIYLRIRTPQTATPRTTSGSYQSAGEDLFRAAHTMLPISGMATGAAPWLAFVLVGQPDEPAMLGASVGAPARDRHIWAGALRKILIDQVAEAVVDSTPDPLHAALLPGRLLVWRDISLAQPPSYPLRFHDDVARSDLLGPLASALQPGCGVVHTELQLILRPRKDWDLQRGWRAAALRRLLKLKARQHYALSDDAKTLEAKLDGPVYDTIVRVLVIAADRTQCRAAQAELNESIAVLGQYAARSGSRLQRLIRIGGG